VLAIVAAQGDSQALVVTVGNGPLCDSMGYRPRIDAVQIVLTGCRVRIGRIEEDSAGLAAGKEMPHGIAGCAATDPRPIAATDANAL
jgi:hypothetical protein